MSCAQQVAMASARALAGVLALIAALAQATAAGAATVGLVTTTLSSGPVSTLSFADGAGERNEVGVKVTTTSVLVTDRASPPVAVAGCAPSADPATVACPLAADHPSLLVDVQGGGGDDALTLLEPDEPKVFDAIVAFLDGGAGNDAISGTGRDSEALLLTTLLVGGDGDDRLVGGSGEDHIYGGAGRDTLVGAGADDELEGDGAGRTVAQFALVLAGKSFERTSPAAPADDVLDGGPGRDSANYPGRTQPLRVDLADPAADGSPGEADRLAAIEDVLGGSGPNVLLGDEGPNALQGSVAATDVLDGRGGPDSLFGRGDGDVLRGGAGDDYLQQPGPGSSCGAGRDSVRNPREAPAVLRPLSFGACELALSRGGIVSLQVAPVRLRAGVFTIGVATALPAGGGDDPVRFAILTGSGRLLASRSVRLGGRRDRVRPLALRLRGRPPIGKTVRVVLYEKGIFRRSLYAELPLNGRAADPGARQRARTLRLP